MEGGQSHLSCFSAASNLSINESCCWQRGINSKRCQGREGKTKSTLFFTTHVLVLDLNYGILALWEWFMLCWWNCFESQGLLHKTLP